MSEVKSTIEASVPIAQVLLYGTDRAAATVLMPLLKENGVPDGTPIEVEVVPRKYDYLATAKWRPL